MSDDRIAGTVRNFGGKVQEGVGKATGDVKTEAQGMMNQATGAVQDAYGKATDAAMDGAQMVKDAAVEGHDSVRKFVETNPFTATAIALGIGLFIGFAAHRQPDPPPLSSLRRWWD